MDKNQQKRVLFLDQKFSKIFQAISNQFQTKVDQGILENYLKQAEQRFYEDNKDQFENESFYYLRFINQDHKRDFQEYCQKVKNQQQERKQPIPPNSFQQQKDQELFKSNEKQTYIIDNKALLINIAEIFKNSLQLEKNVNILSKSFDIEKLRSSIEIYLIKFRSNDKDFSKMTSREDLFLASQLKAKYNQQIKMFEKSQLKSQSIPSQQQQQSHPQNEISEINPKNSLKSQSQNYCQQPSESVSNSQGHPDQRYQEQEPFQSQFLAQKGQQIQMNFQGDKFSFLQNSNQQFDQMNQILKNPTHDFYTKIQTIKNEKLKRIKNTASVQINQKQEIYNINKNNTNQFYIQQNNQLYQNRIDINKKNAFNQLNIKRKNSQNDQKQTYDDSQFHQSHVEGDQQKKKIKTDKKISYSSPYQFFEQLKNVIKFIPNFDILDKQFWRLSQDRFEIFAKKGDFIVDLSSSYLIINIYYKDNCLKFTVSPEKIQFKDGVFFLKLQEEFPNLQFNELEIAIRRWQQIIESPKKGINQNKFQ